MFDQVLEVQCVGLNCIQLACRLYFSNDGIQLCVYASIHYQGGCCNLALLALEKSEPERTVEANITKLLQRPSASPAHLSVEIENHLLNHS